MANVSGNFYKPEPDPGPVFRKNWALIYWAFVKKQTLCISLMQSWPDTGFCILRTISNIFVLVAE